MWCYPYHNLEMKVGLEWVLNMVRVLVFNEGLEGTSFSSQVKIHLGKVSMTLRAGRAGVPKEVLASRARGS